MNLINFIFILIFAILNLFNSSELAACGNHSTKPATRYDVSNVKNHWQSKSKKTSSKLKCCSKKSDTKSCCQDGSCDGNCSDHGCNCPGHSSHTTSFACNFYQGELLFTSAEEGKNKSNFYFEHEKMTEVYLSIWTPPNINC